MKLTKATVTKLALPPGRSEWLVFDDDLPGFGLRLRAGGSATWVAQYRVAGKQRRFKLGSAAAMDASMARQAAKGVLAKASLGEDAQVARLETRAKAADTLGQTVDRYLAEVVVPTQKPRTQVETRRHLSRGWKPLHRELLDRITRRAVAGRLAELATERGTVAANRARAALSALFTWATHQGLSENNPVHGTAKIGRERPRERVLRDDELVDVWLSSGEGDHGRIVRLLLLTGQRRDEVGGMSRGEVDRGRALWTLPGGRVKNGRTHAVPLSAEALAVLSEADRDDGRALFFGRDNGPFSGWSRSKKRLDGRIARHRAARRLGRPLRHGEEPAAGDHLPGWTLHDLRRTAATGMAEIGVQPHIIEAVLNHASGHKGGIAGVYNRAHYSAEKRAAADLWGAHVTKLIGEAGAEVDDGDGNER